MHFQAAAGIKWMQCSATRINITQQLVSTCDNGHDIPSCSPSSASCGPNSGDDNRISDFTQRESATANNNNRERCQLVRTWRVSNLSHHHFQLYTSHYLHLDSSLEFKADKFRINFHPIRPEERERCALCVFCVCATPTCAAADDDDRLGQWGFRKTNGMIMRWWFSSKSSEREMNPMWLFTTIFRISFLSSIVETKKKAAVVVVVGAAI